MVELVSAGLPVAMAAFHALADSVAKCQKDGLSLAPDRPEHLAAKVRAALHGLVILGLNSPEFPWPGRSSGLADDAVTRLVGLTSRAPADVAPNGKHRIPDRSHP